MICNFLPGQFKVSIFSVLLTYLLTYLLATTMNDKYKETKNDAKNARLKQGVNAVLSTLDDWQLTAQVPGLVFHTTSSNTGLNMGVCTLIEWALGTDLGWIGCRHHVYEVMLSDVFSVAFRTSSGPDVALFKRFQKQWPFINREVFTLASDDLFISDDMRRLRDELLVYCGDAMKSQQPRDDYLELLHLSWTFLGEAPGSCVKFRAPGAMHHARWMEKAI